MSERAALHIGEILFATDFSECSDHAFHAALALARHFGARLHVLHVVHRVNVAYHAPERESAQARLEELASNVGPDVPCVAAMAIGAAAPEIVRYAQREKADLIVMGTHGRTGLAHVFVGSVAETVVRQAPCQVLTIRRPAGTVIEAPSASPAGSAPAGPKARPVHSHCLVCAQPSGDLVCDTCKVRIQAEAFYRKRMDEKADTTGHLV